ncbi:hypothetical protein [Chelativorans salis]|uniref:Uncharacterized protein n=1 Tax=Chelativorans salis TaxID=2978478 RepID=A0ABT2LUN8_9HYPH|nr:hypothetical protein [Chelativorans sp. EGI FJ00035]MCT7378248.1 hypothetical protein [Chelativorans sp. EGI FJ00035]
MAERKYEEIMAGDGDLTLWDIGDPAEAADAAVATYGPKASLAAASAAFTARYAGRDTDFRFWFTVFSELQRRNRAG